MLLRWSFVKGFDEKVFWEKIEKHKNKLCYKKHFPYFFFDNSIYRTPKFFDFRFLCRYICIVGYLRYSLHFSSRSRDS